MTNKELQLLIEEVKKLKYEQGYKDGYMEGVRDCLWQFIPDFEEEEGVGEDEEEYQRSLQA